MLLCWWLWSERKIKWPSSCDAAPQIAVVYTCCLSTIVTRVCAWCYVTWSFVVAAGLARSVTWRRRGRHAPPTSGLVGRVESISCLRPPAPRRPPGVFDAERRGWSRCRPLGPCSYQLAGVISLGDRTSTWTARVTRHTSVSVRLLSLAAAAAVWIGSLVRSNRPAFLLLSVALNRGLALYNYILFWFSSGTDGSEGERGKAVDKPKYCSK